MQFNIHKTMLLGGLPLLLIGSSAFGGLWQRGRGG